MNSFSLLRKSLALFAAIAVGALALSTTARAEEKTGGMGMGKSGEMMTVSGEVLDMACYLDHGAHGDGHAACAQKCISSGLPVGLKTSDGTVYLLIGEHKPANSELADYAAKTITVKGKYVSRDGLNLLENIEIVK